MTAPKRHRRAIVWMRRAMRTRDNTPLWAAVEEAEEVLPVVCLRDRHEYRAETPRRVFLRGVLTDLDGQLRELGGYLAVRVGDPVREIPALASQVGAEAVYAAKVYDAETRSRDERIAKALRRDGRRLILLKDAILREETDVVSAGGGPYRVFTPYKRSWLEGADDVPRVLGRPRSLAMPRAGDYAMSLDSVEGFRPRPRPAGETAALKRLGAFIRRGLFGYDAHRDLPAVEGTSMLSGHLANGSISIRTVYWAVREAASGADRRGRDAADVFISELVWREFYYSILANFPRVTAGPFREEFADLPWAENETHFRAWTDGHTGYPIVDAAMRQLNAEGWMHNRARMIVASFLTKDLHINWQRGERFFRKRLADADIASNNGGWQWTAGTGTDASPWFRIFNPVLQGERFDPEGAYVRRYVGELAGVPARAIHKPWILSPEEQRAARCILGKHYPRPIVDHGEARAVAMQLYGKARGIPRRRSLTVRMTH